MAQREVVTLNESTPQLEAPQAGDSYYLVRDVVVATGVFKSEVTDGASAVAFDFDTTNAYGTNGANLARFRNNGAPVLEFSFQGGIDHVNSGASTAAHSQSLNLNWNASSTQTSSGQYSAVIGISNTASGVRSIALGNSNASSGSSSVSMGKNNISRGSASFTMGEANFATAARSFSLGYQADATLQSTISLAAGKFSTSGDAQSVFATLKASTADATQTTLLTDEQNVVIPADTSWVFSALVIGRSDESDGNDSGAYKIEGCLTRDESNNTALVGSVTVTTIAESAGASAWSVTAEAGASQDLAIKVTGEAGTSIRWVAKVDIAQVTYA